jgi:hypothetical protein
MRSRSKWAGVFIALILAAILNWAPATAAEKGAQPPQMKKGGGAAPAQDAKIASPGAVVVPMLPDLIVERCWQGAGCRFFCRFRNIGRGRIPDAQHARAEANLSAGMENPPIRNPVVLPRIDPAGRLKAPGGFVDYDSGCIAKKKSMGLVWIDTNHQVTESSETNNGANPNLGECK